MSDQVKYYKDFNKDMTCLGFQYEIGKTYTHIGNISLCNEGFNAYENTLDVWNFYEIDDPVYIVEMDGVSDKTKPEY